LFPFSLFFLLLLFAAAGVYPFFRRRRHNNFSPFPQRRREARVPPKRVHRLAHPTVAQPVEQVGQQPEARLEPVLALQLGRVAWKKWIGKLLKRGKMF
jgi:hypothetical protein